MPEKTKQRVGDAYGRLPLSFTPNRGQIDRRVHFYAQGAGHAFYFTPEGVRLSLSKGKRGMALHLAPLGASSNARLESRRPLPGRVSYLTGSERQANLPTYREIAYRELWPGVDMVFRGEGGRLKYELRVKPGANPANVLLAYQGAGGLAIGPGGNLLIETPLGTLRDSRPRSYQRIDGRQVPVRSRYALEQGGSAYGFKVGSYDHRQPLVIDPGLTYSTYLGGTSTDIGWGIAVDGSGSAYVAGDTTSLDFPTSVGAFQTSSNGAFDVFVTKLNATGSSLVYSTYLGGVGVDEGLGVAVDGGGNAYATGYTCSSDFPTTAGAYDTSFNGNNCDAFVAKLNAAGSALTYSTYLGGGLDDDVAHDVAIDGSGGAYVRGRTASSDFPTSVEAFDTSFNGGANDVFVTKLNASGSALAYSTFLGGTGQDHNEENSGIAVDGSGSAYVIGDTSSSDFPTTVGAFDTTHNGSTDAFVTKLNASGSAPLDYSTFLGAAADDRARGIVVDASGRAYVTGFTTSSGFPTTAGAFDTSHNGGVDDTFVTKLNATGSAPLDYSTFLGGSSSDAGNAIAVDGGGSAYVTGQTSSSDFPTTVSAFDTTSNGSADVFVTKLNATGSAPLDYSTFLGGASIDLGFGIAVDGSQSAYVTGRTDSSDFSTTTGAYDEVANGGSDAFVTKLPVADGQIVVQKDAIPNEPQDFSFTAGGGLSPASFQLDDDSDGTLSNTRTFTGVASGSGYSISETVPIGWEQSSATCSDGSPISNIDVGPGETVTCTFTNRKSGRIAFHTDRDGNYEIYTMNVDGSAAARVTTNGASDTSPTWSPDGTKIAFESQRDGNSEIYAMNSDGSGVTRLTNNSATDFQPAWSPDGTKVAFSRCCTVDFGDIYTVNADGSGGEIQITTGMATDWYPAWSPDGTKIAFASDRNTTGSLEIYTMSATGTGITRLTNNSDLDAAPDWSPDGAKIAFESLRDGNLELYDMNQDGTAQTNRTTSPSTADQRPSWSPDGARLTYQSSTSNFEVFTMNADGTAQTDRSNDAATDLDPDWQPQPARIVLVKDADPNDPQDFSFTAAGGLSPTSFPLDDDSDATLSNTRTFYGSAPGSGYSLSEGAVPSDWTQTSATCSDGSPISNIDVSAGETVTCTFTNQKDGQIVVVKDASPNDPADFGFTAGGGLSPASFQLDDDSDGTLSNTQTFTGVTPGSGYSIAETTLPSGWTQASATCSDGSSVSNIIVGGGETVTCTFLNTTVGGGGGGVPRPGGATPLRVPLVPAFNKCGTPATTDDPSPSTPDSTHVAPLAAPSCTSPQMKSSTLTIGSLGAAGGSARLDVFCTDLATPPCTVNPGDQADVRVTATATDIRCAVPIPSVCPVTGGDYTGSLLVQSVLRITDNSNGNPPIVCTNGGGAPPCVVATVFDLPISVPASCVATGGANGANCTVVTTLDSWLAGMVKEFQRARTEVKNMRVLDSGPDGVIGGCPPTCGTGDETKLLEQGVFIP